MASQVDGGPLSLSSSSSLGDSEIVGPIVVSPVGAPIQQQQSTGENCINSNGGPNTKCSLCNDTYTAPKVLPCFHTFCQPCLEKVVDNGGKLSCPQCHQECPLTTQGIAGLLSDFAVSNILESAAVEGCLGAHGPGGVGLIGSLYCTACKSKESHAVARCFDCSHFLCQHCVMAHQFMHCFEGHRVMTLGEMQTATKEELKAADKCVGCPRHKGEPLKFFCRSCNVPICKECTVLEHGKGLHEYDYLCEAGPKQVEQVAQLIEEGKLKSNDLRNTLKSVEHTSTRLQVQYHKAQNEINETFQFYRSVLEERKQDALKELDSVYNAKQVALGVLCQKVQDAIEKIYDSCEFVGRLLRYASNTEILLFKKLLDSKFHTVLNYNPEVNLQSAYDIEFVSNYQAIQVGVRNTFGYVRSSTDLPLVKPQPIARPNGSNGGGSCGGGGGNGGGGNGGNVGNGGCNSILGSGLVNGIIERPYQNGHLGGFESNILSKRFSSTSNLGPFSTTLADLNPYEKWSPGPGSTCGSDSIFQNGSDHFSPLNSDPVIDISSKLISLFPPKSQIKRQKMIYHCKFGEFGVLEGQFTEPSGVAVNAQNDIIVADTNNHRIQIFDREGRFKFQFAVVDGRWSLGAGECGKRDGQLLYPNRVAVVRTSGDIVVTERSPTHQIQIYNQYGQFVRKFGANILQHPRGVTVDSKGRIVVVECKVMRVIIFDQLGNVLQKFGCSKHLEFPNGVVVNDKQEIFISDNRAHCVKVFNYEGVYLRQIGGEGITNYPIGVGINQAGEILIADNHNNFNLTIFTQDGNLVNALESKVKHAQCFDVALMDDGSVVLASKDYRLYIYRYLQIPSVGL